MLMDAYRMSLASDCMQETLQDADEDMLHEWAVRKLNKQMPQTQATSF